ncbi:MAG: 4-hydroxy-3-methylbut-2-enyl diphosphate reductase [Elusimicrobiota bacterium]
MDQDLDIIAAETAGFCPGVKTTLERVRELALAGKSPIYTLGALVHNKQVVELLEGKGIRAVASLDEIEGKDGVVVIRAHGIPPEKEAELRASGFEIVDATCPLVKRVHAAIDKRAAEGYTTVIVGDKGHAEVIGLMGYAKGKAFVVSGPEEAEKLPRIEKANVVAQTTQEEDVFRRTAEVIERKSGQTVVSDTICKPTRDRQKETAELAKSVDMMVVIGGKHSANTARLALLCRRLRPNTVHIESADELDPEAVAAAGKVGVTAGASTPGWLTDKVVARIKEIRKAASPHHPQS